MTPSSENQEPQRADASDLEKARHVFESTKTSLKSTVAEARVIENKTRYLLVLTLSVSFGLVGFLTVAVESESTSPFLLNLIWVGGLLLLVLASVSFVLIWNLLPEYKIYYPGSELKGFRGKNNIYSKPLWQTVLTESRSHQQRSNANNKLSEKRAGLLKWCTRAVFGSLASALGVYLFLLWTHPIFG